MTEPLETSIYQIPRQVAGQGSRVRMNAAIDRVDQLLGGLAGQMAALDSEIPRVKLHAPIVAVGGETTITLQEPYQFGAARLEVNRGGVEHAPGIHWDEVDGQHILFFDPCEPGEVILVTEHQLGRDAGALPPLPVGPTFTVTETPVGATDSTDGVDGNGTFTLAHDVAPSSTPRVRISGFIELVPVSHFTWAANIITVLPGYKPMLGEPIEVEYEWTYL